MSNIRTFQRSREYLQCGSISVTEDRSIQKRVAQDQRSNTRHWSTDGVGLCKLLGQKSAQSSSKKVDSLKTERVEKTSETGYPVCY